MARIFISYRRADSADITGRIYDRLNCPLNRFYNGMRLLPGLGRLPATTVFKDVDAIEYGTHWREELEKALDQCDVLLAIIGPDWVGQENHGNRRIDDPDDMVRIEVAIALARKGVKVIPVLVNGAALPSKAILPPNLKNLPDNHAISIRNDPDFHRDMDRLVRTIQPLCRRSVMMAFSVAAVLLLVAITGVIITLTRPANVIAPGAPTTTPAVTPVAAADTPSQAPSELPPPDTAVPTVQPSATTAPSTTAVLPLTADVAADAPPTATDAPTLTTLPTQAPDLRLIRSYGALVLCVNQAADLSGLAVRIGNNESYMLGTSFPASATTTPGGCWCLAQPDAILPGECTGSNTSHQPYYGYDWHTQAVNLSLDGHQLGDCPALTGAAAVETCAFYLDLIQGGN